MVLEYPVADPEMPPEIKVQDRVLQGEPVASQPGQQPGEGEQPQKTYSQKSA